MTNVERSGDCGNSPKNKLVEDLSIALALSDTEFLLGHVTDDVRWRIVGKAVITGKEDFAKAVGTVMSRVPLALTIYHVMTHGRVGAVNGRLTVGEAEAREFCDVYEFSSAKGASVRAITTYMIDCP